jgi:hypothetical protein
MYTWEKGAIGRVENHRYQRFLCRLVEKMGNAQKHFSRKLICASHDFCTATFIVKRKRNARLNDFQSKRVSRMLFESCTFTGSRVLSGQVRGFFPVSRRAFFSRQKRVRPWNRFDRELFTEKLFPAPPSKFGSPGFSICRFEDRSLVQLSVLHSTVQTESRPFSGQI